MKRVTFIFLFALALASCKNAKGPTETDKSFDYFKDRFVEKWWALNPSSALFAGYHKYDAALVIPEEKYILETQVNGFKQLLDSLHTFKTNSLSENNQIDYKMMENQLEGSIWYNTTFRSWEWSPSEYNIAGEFAQIISENYDKLDNRLRVLGKRLEGVPSYYQAARKNIKHPTKEHTELAIQQNKGGIAVFEGILQDSLKKSGLSAEEKAAISVKSDAAKKAILEYVTWLEKDLLPGMNESNTRSFRLGKELYAKKFEYDIVSGYSADQIYEKALKRRNTLHGEMAKISRGLWKKYYAEKPMPKDSLELIRMMIDTISRNHVHRDSFITAIKHQIPELVSFVGNKNLLYIDPKKPLVVRETPKYMQGVAGASITSPGPYEKNANTYYNVTPLDNYTPAQAESYLREYNHFILQILNIHEAIPGHYTQLVYSNQSPSIIKSIFGNGAMVEGWAVYTERMMLEQGYGNNEPEMWLMYYKWHLRVVCNTILDHSVHVLGMSKEEALNLLMNSAFQEKAEAEGKWRRVSLTQVQLCSYFTGFTEIYDLREELKSKEGSSFNLKAFHEKFLSYGSAPVKYIKELMKVKK